jgi:hypothetical protein
MEGARIRGKGDNSSRVGESGKDLIGAPTSVRVAGARINDLITLPPHVSTTPRGPTAGYMNVPLNIQIDDIESTRDSRGIGKAPTHANRLTCSLAQIALNSFPAQNDGQRPERTDNERDSRNAPPDYEIFRTHTGWLKIINR